MRSWPVRAFKTLKRVEMKRFLVAAIIAMPLFGVTSGYAEAPVQGTMEAFVVELKNDKEQLKAAEDVEPNQIVEYQLTYTNKSNLKIAGLTVVGPVPEGTTYVSDTANADVEANLKVSIDGGLTFEQEPVTREVVKANGEVIEKVIPSDEYTHLQWTAQSAIEGEGGKQFYRYRVRVK